MKFFSCKRQFYSIINWWPQAGDTNYRYLKLNLNPLRGESAGFNLPSTDQTVNNADTEHVFSTRTELAALASLYKWCRVRSWSVKFIAPFNIEMASTERHYNQTSATGSTDVIRNHMYRWMVWSRVCHEIQGDRNTDATDAAQAKVYLMGLNNTRTYLDWPDRGEDQYIMEAGNDTGLAVNGGTETFVNLVNKRGISKHWGFKNFTRTWTPKTMAERQLAKIRLRNAAELEAGTATDTVLLTGMEDDVRLGGVWLAVPSELTDTATFDSGGGSNATVTPNIRVIIQVKVRYAVWGRR